MSGKALLPGFADDDDQEDNIKVLESEVGDLFRECEKRLKAMGRTKSEGTADEVSSPRARPASACGARPRRRAPSASVRGSRTPPPARVRRSRTCGRTLSGAPHSSCRTWEASTGTVDGRTLRR
jgi:hypothetical protein